MSKLEYYVQVEVSKIAISWYVGGNVACLYNGIEQGSEIPIPHIILKVFKNIIEQRPG